MLTAMLVRLLSEDIFAWSLRAYSPNYDMFKLDLIYFIARFDNQLRFAFAHRCYLDAELLNALVLRRDCCSVSAVKALQVGALSVEGLLLPGSSLLRVAWPPVAQAVRFVLHM